MFESRLDGEKTNEREVDCNFKKGGNLRNANWRAPHDVGLLSKHTPKKKSNRLTQPEQASNSVSHNIGVAEDTPVGVSNRSTTGTFLSVGIFIVLSLLTAANMCEC